MKLRVLGLGVACSLALALPAHADSPDLSGDYSLAGRDTKLGDYSGKLTLKSDGSGNYLLSADATTTSGQKITWTGTATAYGERVFSVKLTLASDGITGALMGGASASEVCSGWYTVSNGGKKISGSWKSQKDPSHRSAETATRGDAPAPPPAPTIPVATADLLDLVRPDGADAKEECLADDQNGANPADPLPLKVKHLASAGADAKIVLETTARVALWKTSSKQPDSRIASGDSLANADATIYVEGLAPSDAGVGETISAKVVSGSQPVAKDAVVAHVARNAFHLAGHGSGGAGQMMSWLSKARRDSRTRPSFVEGKDEKTGKRVFWAVWLAQDEQGAKIALATPDAVISYDGHSNFGMGFAFQTGFTSISQFLLIADPQVPVNWPYLREHQDHPGLMIADSEYGDDASTPEFSDPIQVGSTVHGKLANYDNARYPETGSGLHLHLTRGPQKWLDHHYGETGDYRIVIKAGSRDMPVKRWSKIYLHSCYSGQYYSDSFGGRGTLFFTHDEASAWSAALPAFIRSCVEGKSDDQILEAINKEENLNDYIKLGS
jgi:hypothetical protein